MTFIVLLRGGKNIRFHSFLPAYTKTIFFPPAPIYSTVSYDNQTIQSCYAIFEFYKPVVKDLNRVSQII